jgi:hypothetical protein
MEVSGRSRLIRQPSSRNGGNPPCGMIGGRWKRRHHSKSATRHRPPRQFPTRASQRATYPTYRNPLGGKSNYLRKLLELVGNFVNASLNAGLVFVATRRTGCARRADGFVADFDR